MITEKSFEDFLNVLCCRGCKFFIDNKCTEKDADVHNIDKEGLRKLFYDVGVKGLKDANISEGRREMLQYYIDSSKDIESTFVCKEFD